MSDPCSAGFFSRLFSGDAIICSGAFQSYEQSQEEAGIQSVADNASTNYGAGSLTASVAAQASNAQILASKLDTSTINSELAQTDAGKILNSTCDGAPGIDLSIVGGPCLSYDQLKKYGLYAGLGIGALIILYVLGIVSSFIPKRR